MLKYTVGEHWRFQSYSISLSLSNLLQFYYFARTYLDNLRILYLVDKAQPLHLIFIYQVMSLLEANKNHTLHLQQPTCQPGACLVALALLLNHIFSITLKWHYSLKLPSTRLHWRYQQQ